MKRALQFLVLLAVSTAAFALPAPKDIEAAVKAGNLAEAETMLRQVIKEKPDSAKAHYELGQVLAREGRRTEAREELLAARRADPSLKFAKDPRHFREFLDKLPSASAPPPVSANHQTTQPPPPPEPAFPWGYLLLGGGVLVVVWLLVSRATAAARAPAVAGMAGGGAGSYAPGYGAPPQAAGSGIGGAVLGGVAGMAAGYGLAKLLEKDDAGGHESRAAPADSGFIPIDTPPEDGEFDAGSGDSWDDGGSSGDDNW